MSTFNLVLLITLAVMLATLLCVVAVTVFHHFWTRRRLIERAEMADEIRPQLMAMLLEDEPDLSRFETDHGLRSRLIDDLAEALIGKLRGADRERLVQLLDRRGTLHRARRELSSRRAPTRARAIQLLGSTGAPGALPDLTPALRDRNRTVREVATRSIGRLGDPAATGSLLSLLAGEDQLVPEHLVRMALFRLGRPAVPDLIRELRNPSAAVRSCAAEVLGHLGAPEAIEPLSDVAFFDDDGEVSLTAVDAIHRIDGPSTADALRRLASGSQSPGIREAAMAVQDQRAATDVVIGGGTAGPGLAVGNG